MSNAKQAYITKQREITELMAQLTQKLAEHSVNQSKEESNWSLVGDLTHIANQLADLNNFLE
jgi:hypothetical protein